jgi:hypothetical protein
MKFRGEAKAEIAKKNMVLAQLEENLRSVEQRLAAFDLVV